MGETGEFLHLPAETRPIARLGMAERIAHIRAERWIPHAAADHVLTTLQEAFDQPPRLRRENVLLLGESGMGKSMLIEKFARANAVAPDQDSGTRRRPVLVISAPPAPTEAELFECVLDCCATIWMRICGNQGEKILIAAGA